MKWGPPEGAETHPGWSEVPPEGEENHLKGVRSSLKEERRPWKEGGRHKPKKDVYPPKIGTIVKYLELIPQLDGGCKPDIHVPTPGTLGTLFQTEPEFKLDKEEQELILNHPFLHLI